MTRRPLVLLACLLLAFSLAAPVVAAPPEIDLSYYLPGGDYDPAIPKPGDVLGWEVGTWHARHDQLVLYMKTLAAASERISLEVTGHTHEGREQLLLTITHPDNHARLEEIRAAHLKLSDPSAAKPDTADMPVVAWLGYSIHGNEPSGANASLVVAYHLAAARGPEIEQLLRESVLLLDPSFNPDGLGRFAVWANMHKGRVPASDPGHREHREGWPSGRTNHYWFDLNRDWLPAVHPESRNRLARFHAWRPNLLTDHHEMGADSTYFFQPGIPSRRNPLTPQKNVELTEKIARFHAATLDEIGSLYFTQERFDDFYYGKGSTYPDIHGGVGILFEQASSRGHVQDTSNGELTFPFTIRNQVRTSLSSIRAAHSLRRELLDYQASFYRDALAEAEDDALGGWVFGDPRDPARTHAMVELLRRHQIEVHALAEAVDAGGASFQPGGAYVVPVAQAQARLARSIFERRTTFGDSVFYDVSTWTIPLAYGLPHAELIAKAWRPALLGQKVGEPAPPRGKAPAEAAGYAYVFDWDGYFAPRALHRLLDAEARAYVAERPFELETDRGRRRFLEGAIVVPVGVQEIDPATLLAVAQQIAAEDAVDVYAVDTGLAEEGIDLGSPSLRALTRPTPVLLVGDGVASYEAGEVWHLLDQRFQIELPLLEVSDLDLLDLREHTHLLLVDGAWDRLGDDKRGIIDRFVRGGGVLVATKRAAKWAESLLSPKASDDKKSGGDGRSGDTGNGGKTNGKDKPNGKDKVERRPYAEHRQDAGTQLISGTIFEVELDTTHPLAFGYRNARLPIFRDSRIFLEPIDDPYATVARYTEAPLLSGFISDENLPKVQGTPAVVAQRLGRGTVIRIVDNPNFRGFWYGTNKLYLNAIFFGGILDRTAAP